MAFNISPRVCRRFAYALTLLACAFAAAQDKPVKKEPPKITLTLPLGVLPGSTNLIKVRGVNFTNASTVRFTVAKTSVEAKIKSNAKAEVPKDFDAKRIGDTQLEVELKLPPETPPGPLTFVVVTPDGESPPHALIVLDPSASVVEQEPNEGFRNAQEIPFSKTMQGSIQSPGDVDVFRFTGKAGEQIAAEVFAARHGSALDSILTLYNARGQILASNDDSEAGADSLLRVRLPADGIYYLGLVDAFDRGGPLYLYNLEVRREK